MTKTTKAVTGTLVVYTDAQQIVAKQGTLVSHDEHQITVDLKRHGSKKTDRTTFPRSDVLQAWLSQNPNETYVYVRGVSEDNYGDVTVTSMVDGTFTGISGDSAILAAPGTWRFLPDVSEVDADEAPAKAAPKAKAKAAPVEEEEEEEAPAKPAKGKAKAAPVEEEVEEEEEAEEEAYVPEVGDTVTVTDAEEEETTGEVEAINAKTITVAGTKFKIAEVTIVAAEAEEVVEFEPEVGSYVTMTMDDDSGETTGEVTKLTSKKITVTDAAGEVTAADRSDVTVVEAERPKAKKAPAKKAAVVEEEEEEEEEEEAPAKPAKKAPAKKAAVVEEEEEEEEAKPAKKAPAKKAAAAASDDWDE